MENQKRKEMAKTYVQTHRPMGVYQLKNKANGKILVESSLDLNGAFNRLKFTLSMGVHTNKELQRDWNEFGEEQFSFEILQQIKPREEFLQQVNEQSKYKDELKALEAMYLEELQPYGERGYNKMKKEI